MKKLEKELGHELVPVDPDYSKKIDSTQLEVIWSRTVDSVVIGRSYRGEYISQLDTQEREAILYPTFITDFISKNDFLAFRNWLRDSVARELIYFGTEDYDESNKFIQIRDEHFSQSLKKIVKTDIEDREYNREVFPLNWNEKLDYRAPYLVPLLSGMYLPQPERFRKKHTFDMRKIWYRHTIEGMHLKSNVPILIDSYTLAEGAAHAFDKRTVLSYLHDDLYLDAPVSFIEPFMAEAYCHWKSVRLNQELRRSDTKISCRLPSLNEIEAISPKNRASLLVEEYDYTQNWRISNSDFREFCSSVLDSTLREYLFENEVDRELALSLIEYDNYFFSETDLEYVDVDPYRKEELRYYFHWNEDKVNWLKFGYIGKEELIQKLNIDSVSYRYYWMDAINRSVNGELAIKKTPDVNWRKFEILELKQGHYDANGEPIGKDLRMDGNVGSQWGNGTRSHENLQRFNRFEILRIPLPNQVPDNDEIADITYQQALAFYNWKFRIDLYNEGDEGDWQQFVFPSEDEFERIKNGETVIQPTEEIQYDSPVFRMVIELVPKE
ncbi:MAG: hypothetical protein Crog4KO_25510 [Crocinitomicaceae bacterium]